MKGSMENWAPCELEAYTHAMAIEDNSIYVRESNNPLICLSDNSTVEDAAKKIKKGLYSSSPRLQSLVSAVQRYNVSFHHISGKLPSDFINVADFSSRNPIDCSRDNCQICGPSQHPDYSFSTVNFMDSSTLPIISKKAWLKIQLSSRDCKIVK